MDETNGEPAAPGSGLSGFLTENGQSGGIGADAALLRRAVKERWPMKPEVRAEIMARLGKIIAKDTVPVPVSGPDGVSAFQSEGVADRNATAAANVLRLMTEEDRGAEFKAAGHIQAERHHREGKKVQKSSVVRIIVEDARGNQRTVGSLREFYASQAPPPVRPPTALPAVGSEAESGQGG